MCRVGVMPWQFEYIVVSVVFVFFVAVVGNSQSAEQENRCGWAAEGEGGGHAETAGELTTYRLWAVLVHQQAGPLVRECVQVTGQCAVLWCHTLLIQPTVRRFRVIGFFAVICHRRLQQKEWIFKTVLLLSLLPNRHRTGQEGREFVSWSKHLSFEFKGS